MGDVALTIPVLLAVVEKYNDVNLIFVTRPFFASFIPNHPQIQTVSRNNMAFIRSNNVFWKFLGGWFLAFK